MSIVLVCCFFCVVKRKISLPFAPFLFLFGPYSFRCISYYQSFCYAIVCVFQREIKIFNRKTKGANCIRMYYNADSPFLTRIHTHACMQIHMHKCKTRGRRNNKDSKNIDVDIFDVVVICASQRPLYPSVRSVAVAIFAAIFPSVYGFTSKILSSPPACTRPMLLTFRVFYLLLQRRIFTQKRRAICFV